MVDIFVSLECSRKQVLIEQQMAKGKIEGTGRRHEFQRDKLFKEQGRKIMQWTVKKKSRFKMNLVAQAITPELWRQRQENHEFKTHT